VNGDELGDGSWAEWRRAVLGDLRRLTDDMRVLHVEVRGLARAADVEELERRIVMIEAQLSAGSQKNEDRKWLIGLAVLVVASILFPSLRVVLFGGGG
jgi:hypothetical protein